MGHRKTSLAVQLRTLKGLGVAQASFHPDGGLASVTFGEAFVLAPVAAEPEDDGLQLPEGVIDPRKVIAELNRRKQGRAS
jgi:hypothetical protein